MRKTRLFGYLLAVFGIGVLFGMLYAPREGDESRKMLLGRIQDCYKKSCDFITEKAKELKDNIDENA